MTDSPPTHPRRPDYFFGVIVALVLSIFLWLLLMPWVPAIASVTLHRFHLRTGTFMGWAIQQPIPSMYNFANRFEVREIPEGLLDPVLDTAEKRYLNHFPPRILTFANTRYRYLHDGKDRWLTIDSSYRGQTIQTRYHARPRQSGGYDMILLPPGEEP